MERGALLVEGGAHLDGCSEVGQFEEVVGGEDLDGMEDEDVELGEAWEGLGLGGVGGVLDEVVELLG